MGFMDGYTVLEVGEYVTVPYAGKLLSDLGADVIKLEPPTGDPARQVEPFADEEPGVDASGFFGYLNTGKMSVTLPWNEAVARGLVHAVIESYEVDLVIEDDLSSHGVHPEGLAERHDVPVVSVTGFGRTGPFQEYEATDLVAWAESGHMNKMGHPNQPPTRPRIKSADYWAGQATAIGGLSAMLSQTLQGGRGQVVDVSKREAALSAMEHFIAGYAWGGEPTQRTGFGYPDQDGEDGFPTIFETADGYISMATINPGIWDAFCEEVLERPELVNDERFDTQPKRQENLDQVNDLIENYTRDRAKWEVFEEVQNVGIPSGVTCTVEEVYEFEHLREREFWEEVPLPNGEEVTMPGFPFRVDDDHVSVGRAPRLGEHTTEVVEAVGYDAATLAGSNNVEDASQASASATLGRTEREPRSGAKPLDGVRVLDFTWVYAGPFGSKLLAGLGADVVKVESRRKPDLTRSIWSYGEFDLEVDSSASAYFNEHNQGKRGIQLDLTSDRGHELALELIEEADVLMENYSPEFMQKVDLEYDRVSEINPELVYLSMPGWAKSGPATDYRALGNNLQSMAGLDLISGRPEDPPTPCGLSWPDPTSGYMAATAVLAALNGRESSGEGAFIEVPQFETTVSLLHKPIMEYVMNGRIPDRVGSRDEDGRYVQGVYPCTGDDRWAVVSVETDEQWAALCDAMGRPDLVDDERFASQYARFKHHDEVDAAIRNWTTDRTAEEVRLRLQKRDVPAGVVLNERDLVEDCLQLRARDYFSEHDHPEVGTRTFQGMPLSMEDSSIQFGRRSPLFGEHTQEVLEKWLGLSAEEIEQLESAEALH